ncbi:MAG: ferredoxin family protein, partial [Sedimentisphaerales bacterium]|nr:ferredoxin family protein [Sedimentisphaerales bacterium]
MTTPQDRNQRRIIFCGCVHYDIIPEATKRQIFEALQADGIEVTAVADLCGLAAHSDPQLAEWTRAGAVSIVACFPRAVRWLFEVAGAPLPAKQVQLLNMRTQTPEEIVSALGANGASGPAKPISLPEKPEAWVPWFPVIDYDRCVNCKQCMNFCLFGVYELSPDGQVRVGNPSGCKTNCPACARMCPRQAIIFPKYGDAPINGDEVGEPTPAQGKPDGDLRSLLAGDAYAKIRQRTAGRKRFSKETDGPAPTPSGSTLEKLRQELDIPLDVLTAL